MSVANAINLLRNLTGDTKGQDQSALAVNNSLVELFLLSLVQSIKLSSTTNSDKSTKALNYNIANLERLFKNQVEFETPIDNTNQEQNGENNLLVINKKLENIGFRVGTRIAERYSADIPRLVDTLDVVKYICKDVWYLVFQKQIDNLKTNHKGIYILQDLRFKWITKISNIENSHEALNEATHFLNLACGILKGVLYSFGVKTEVTFNMDTPPKCNFQVKEITRQLA